jgi:hypothetical protein
MVPGRRSKKCEKLTDGQTDRQQTIKKSSFDLSVQVSLKSRLVHNFVTYEKYSESFNKICSFVLHIPRVLSGKITPSFGQTNMGRLYTYEYTCTSKLCIKIEKHVTSLLTSKLPFHVH